LYGEQAAAAIFCHLDLVHAIKQANAGGANLAYASMIEQVASTHCGLI
jgi:hypothetical protein